MKLYLNPEGILWLKISESKTKVKLVTMSGELKVTATIEKDFFGVITESWELVCEI